MRHIKISLLLLIVAGLIVQCNSLRHRPEQEYVYVPLKDYKYDPASIQPGTEVKLLAFSGGKQTETDGDVYYYQFIVLNESTGDTLRILTPFISVDESAEGKNKTYTKPWQFDPAKGITEAFYELCDSSSKLLLQTNLLIETNRLDTSADFQSLVNNTRLNEFVVVNKSMGIFEDPAYKTAIGILNFKKMPW
jgi:hypothetical protein